MTYPKPKGGVGLKTICVDLDGTLAEPTWPKPEIGAPIPATVDAVIEASREGWEIVVFTARPESHKTEIKLWLLANGLADIVYDVICGKPRAAAYWDDRAVTFPEAFWPTVVVARYQHGAPYHWHEHSMLSGHKPDHEHAEGPGLVGSGSSPFWDAMEGNRPMGPQKGDYLDDPAN